MTESEYIFEIRNDLDVGRSVSDSDAMWLLELIVRKDEEIVKLKTVECGLCEKQATTFRCEECMYD